MRRKIVLGISTCLFLILVLLLLFGMLTPIDISVSKWIYTFVAPEITVWMKRVTDFGDVIGLGIMSLLMLIFLYIKRPNKIPFFLLLMILSLFCAQGLKFVFQRARPDIMHLFTFNGYSFPSAHTLMNASFYGYLITSILEIYHKSWRYVVCAFFLLILLAIGLSRIYLGAHYLSDVFTGYTVSLGLLNIILILEEKRKEKNV